MHRFKNIVVIILLLLTPVVISLLWGPYFADATYLDLAVLRNLDVGGALTEQFGQIGPLLPQRSPLYASALVILAMLGLPLLQAAMFVSALGWGLTAVATYVTCFLLNRPFAGAVAAGLIALAPAFLDSLGTPYTWFVALAILAIAATWRQQWILQTALLVLLILTYFAPITLFLTILLLGSRWLDEKHVAPLPTLLVLTTALGWGALSYRFFGTLIGPIDLDIIARVKSFSQSESADEWLWFFLPLALLGLAAVYLEFRISWLAALALLGVVVAVLADAPTAWLVATAAVMMLSGLGLDLVQHNLQGRAQDGPRRPITTVLLSLVIFLPVAFLQLVTLRGHFVARPEVFWQLERQAGQWLRQNSNETAAVLASPHVGYVADRFTLPLERSNGIELDALSKLLREETPDYLVAWRSLAADQLARADWFQENYEPTMEFGSPFDSVAPLTIWGYRPTVLGLGEGRPLNVKTSRGVSVVGYEFHPKRIQPGDDLEVSLHLRAAEPLTETFETIMRLKAADGSTLAMSSTRMPSTVSPAAWRPEQVIVEPAVIHLEEDLPYGAYGVDFSFRTPGDEDVWPLFRNEDINPLDRVSLGYVGLPWNGPVPEAELVDALYGNQVRLTGYSINDDFAPGGAALVLTLFWKPERVPDDDYVVYVHALSQAGQLVANHDSQPADGRFPTSAWLPGDIVIDQHPLALGQELPTGTYQLMVGMYLPGTGERLAVVDGDGQEVPDRSLPLTSITIQ